MKLELELYFEIYYTVALNLVILFQSIGILIFNFNSSIFKIL